jgi:hypothetical protein
MTITTTEALASLLPGFEFTLVDDQYDSIVWVKEPKTKPTLEEIEAEKTNLINRQIAARQSVLDKLGLTEEELKAVLG